MYIINYFQVDTVTNMYKNTAYRNNNYYYYNISGISIIYYRNKQ